MMPPISNEDGNWTQSIAVDGGPMEQEPSRYVYFNAVSSGYFQHARHARRCADAISRTPTRPTSARVVIVNESLVRRFFPNAESARTARSASAGASAGATCRSSASCRIPSTRRCRNPRAASRIFRSRSMASNGISSRRCGPSARRPSIADRVRTEVRALDARVPVRIETVSDRIRESLVKERVMAVLASSLGVTALALACAGALRAARLRRVAAGQGDRPAARARRHACGRAVDRPARLPDRRRDRHHASAPGVSLALGRYVRALLFQVSAADAISLAVAGRSCWPSPSWPACCPLAAPPPSTQPWRCGSKAGPTRPRPASVWLLLGTRYPEVRVLCHLSASGGGDSHG